LPPLQHFLPENPWTGFTLGINAGAILNHTHGVLKPSGDFIGYDDYNALRTDSMNFSKTAFTGGVQLGYNYQYNWFLIGLETDFNYSSPSVYPYNLQQLQSMQCDSFETAP